MTNSVDTGDFLIPIHSVVSNSLPLRQPTTELARLLRGSLNAGSRRASLEVKGSLGVGGCRRCRSRAVTSAVAGSP